jgi:hypothetical protein
MQFRRRRQASAIASLALLIAAAAPVHAADNGTVPATVTADGGACIVVGGSLSYGTLPFRSADEDWTSSTSTASVSNCDPLAAADLFVRGTSAVNANNSVAWNLGPLEEVACPGFGLDRYLHVVLPLPFTGGSERYLSDVDQTFSSVPINSNIDLTGEIAMPCEGSGGGGQTMTFAVLVTATKGA